MPILKSIAANKKVKDKVYTQTPASLKRILEYVTRKGKDQSEVYKAYGVGLNDNIDIAFKEIMFNKRAFDKIDGRQYKHYAISYPPGFNDLETIEKIATRFVEENFFKRGFKCYVAIHTDKDHYHTHIIADSVNFLNGYKLQEITEKQLLKARYKDKELNTWEVRLEELKTSLEEISLEYGVPSPERNPDKAKTKNIGKMSKYKALEKDNSWRNYIARVWEETILETTTTMENLEQKLKEKGIYFNRFNAENKSLTLATEYTVGEEKKVGKIRLNKLAGEEDYRFQATPNLYQWDNFVKILEKHKEKEVEEELTEDDIEKTLLTLEKDAELEKEFKREIEEVKIELDKGREYKTITSIMLGYKEFYKEITSFLKEVEDHKKDFKNLDEIKKIKENEGWELILEFNQAHALNKQREKERETERTEKEKQEKIKAEEERKRKLEDEKIRRNNEYNERHDRIRSEEKAREQERIKLNRAIEDNKFKDDIKEREIKPAAEEKEVEKTTKRKEKDREYGE
ncbi:relaxase/mobilization nuclease domain-containing protein [Fusobacterium polymorphum]|uniref:relaxase/mobilization nuclease domain-containing protein n=1 Tax=Fusobacterium nucleatum subsp. polymorphum TaxID=76857 RepID=UPI00300BF567